MSISDVKLEQMSVRLNRSNIGPWQATTNESHMNWMVVDGQSLPVATCHFHTRAVNSDNAVFIANARQDMYLLLSEVARLKVVLSEVAEDGNHQMFARWSERMLYTQTKCDEMASAMEEAFKQLRKAQSVSSTDGPVYNRGRAEGQSDIVSKIRKILDPKNLNHWDADGIMKEIERLASLGK